MSKTGCQRHWCNIQERHLDQKYTSGKSRLQVGGIGSHRTEEGCGRGLKQEVSDQALRMLRKGQTEEGTTTDTGKKLLGHR